MKTDRREFLMTGAALGAAARAVTAQPAASDDPLGIRAEFPVAETETYLNSPYIAPPPRAVEQAGIDFVRSKTRDPIPLGAMLDKANEVRDSFASLFGAASEEISFLFATSEGENVVARALELGDGDNVVVDDLHYETSYVLYRTLEETRGLEVRIAKSIGGARTPSTSSPWSTSERACSRCRGCRTRTAFATT